VTRPDPSAWLAQVHEEVLEPDLAIVDPHHHLWSYPGSRGFQPVYLLEELRADTGSGHRVDATVFVECDWAYRSDGPEHLRCVGETTDVARRAIESARTPGARIAAIVGSCDLSLDAARLGEVLDAHEEAGQGLFRGIRHRLANDPTGSAHTSRTHAPSPDLMRDDAFRAGVAELGRRGHSFEVWVYHPQLPDVAELASAVPGTTMVLNHIGAPLGIGTWADRREEVFAAWRDSLTEIAARPNVIVKVGGIGMPAYGSGWSTRDRPASSDEIVAEWGRHLRKMIETFGPSRCMFESNFPVDKVSCSYRVLWNAFKKISAHLPDADRCELFGGTAGRVYRI
jgi:predicted TIM-barrel fold metal-dependent hydrolase